jgi:hypothetical protein
MRSLYIFERWAINECCLAKRAFCEIRRDGFVIGLFIGIMAYCVFQYNLSLPEYGIGSFILTCIGCGVMGILCEFLVRFHGVRTRRACDGEQKCEFHLGRS